MSAPEHGEPPPSAPPSQLPEPYQRAVRFRSEEIARRAYFHAQEAVFAAPCDLSVTRFLLDRVSHVAVIGEPPHAELDRRLRRILSAGEPVALPEEILRVLWQRRLEANRGGLWIERHWRPGQPL